MSKRTIQIDRKGYTYKRKVSGKRSKVTVKVPRSKYSISDPGKPGRRSRGTLKGPFSKRRGYKSWISHKREGKLGGKGYLGKPMTQRRVYLDKCVRKYGYRSCLGSIMVLERNSSLKKAYGSKLKADRNYLKNKYGGEGSFGPNASTRKGYPRKTRKV